MGDEVDVKSSTQPPGEGKLSNRESTASKLKDISAQKGPHAPLPKKPELPNPKPPSRKNKSSKLTSANTSQPASAGGAGWLSWISKKPEPKKVSPPPMPRARSTPEPGPPQHKQKKTWGELFRWGAKVPSTITRAPSKPSAKGPNSKKSKHHSISIPTPAPPPPPPPLVFKEINLDRLVIHGQRKEFEGELAMLNKKYNSAVESGDAKVQAESKLKINTLQQIVDEMVLYREPPVDVDSIAYTFWLMDTLKQTMKPSGGFITPSIYVPQIVWLQPQGKLVRYHLKMDICNQLLKCLIMIEADFTFHKGHTERLMKGLDALNKRLESMQNTLAFQLSEVIQQTEKDEKTKMSTLGSFGTAIAKGTARLRNYALPTKLTQEESNSYVTVISAIFEKSKFLKDLLVGNEDKKDLCAKVEHVLEFLRTVVCTFVLHDMTKLMERYQAVCSRSLLK